jgi:hypothetical protein
MLKMMFGYANLQVGLKQSHITSLLLALVWKQTHETKLEFISNSWRKRRLETPEKKGTR